MPTTPISVSTGIQSVTNTTVYTVPAGRTAIVKAVSGQGSTGSTSLTVSKQISGQNYVVVNTQPSDRTPATGGTQTFNNNALQAPLTLGASDVLRVYTASSNAYSLPSVSTATNTAADGSNYQIYANLFANGIYMAVGSCTSGPYVATSSDAITWTQQTGALPFGTQFNTLACNGSVWVAANKDNTQGTVYYSSDNGVTWGAAVVASGSLNCGAIVSNGSIFGMYLNNGKVYSSSNGSTWTESTSYFTAVGGALAMYNIGWTGSYWIVNNSIGSLATDNFTTWYGYAGVSLGRSFTNVFSTEYSSAYGRYYTSRNLDSVPNIWSSTNGLLWENLYSGAFTPFKINCAGSNTVLIAVGSSGGTAVLKSTNGSTWATATTQGSYAGPMWGLENGYYFTMFDQGSTDACMLSTDPTVSTGTTRGNQTSGFYCRNAAADPISGKWVGVGDEGTNIYMLGGTSGTNIGTTYNPSLTVGAAGTPNSVCWSAADGYFYMITTTARVYRSTAYNSTWTLVATGVGSAGAAQPIKAVGTTLYVASNGQTSSIWISSTLTGGASWTQFSFTSTNPNAYTLTGQISGGGYYNGEAFATDGTNLVWTNTAGAVFALTPSVGTTTMRIPIPRAVGMPQTVNGNTFLYGGYSPSYGPVYGYFTSTNVITTYGTFISYGGTNYYWANTAAMPNVVNYIGGSYYVTSTGINGQVWSSTTPTTIFDNTTPPRYAGLGATYAGIISVNPSNGWMIDGTNLVSSQSGQPLTGVCKTSTPSNFLYAATVTASIVEIS
jgi:hypothetical protein